MRHTEYAEVRNDEATQFLEKLVELFKMFEQ